MSDGVMFPLVRRVCPSDSLTSLNLRLDAKWKTNPPVTAFDLRALPFTLKNPVL